VAVGEAQTLEGLNRLVGRVRARVPFYRERLQEAPLSALEQFGELPFTTKEDFRQAYPYGMLAVPLEDVVRIHASSGTTGRPVITAYTRGDLDLWGECMERVLGAGAVTAALKELKRAATGGANIMPASIACAKAGVQAIADQLF